MGAFTGNPAPLGDPGLVPAPDVPPDNDFDPTQFFNSLVAAAQKAGVPGAQKSTQSDAALDAYAKELAALNAVLPSWMIAFLKGGSEKLNDILDVILAMVFILLGPARETVGKMAGAWIDLFAAEQAGRLPGQPAPKGTATQTAAAAAFDSIMKPIGLLGSQSNPHEKNVGQQNAEFVLGSLVNLHLDTWVVDILSKVTGFGIFEWLHNFDEAVVGAMNTRGMARLAMRPFFNTFITQPLTRDLNANWMLAHPPAGSLVKSYLRGALDAHGLQQKLAELGFGPDVVEQFLLDSSHPMSMETLVWLMKQGQLDEQAAQKYLEMYGYTSTDADATITYHRLELLYQIWRKTAEEIVDQVRNGTIDPSEAKDLMANLGLTEAEQEAYIQLGTFGAKAKFAKFTLKKAKPGPHLSYEQVVRAFQESILSLDDVYQWLADRGYSDDDTRTLVLLDFTVATERAVRHAEMGALYRTRAVTAAETAAKATAAADAAKASAYTALAKKYSDLASVYGG
jgi:hypothetical protein